jgi:hypothetical protein
MMKSQTKGAHSAVIEADRDKLARHSGIEEGAPVHLRPASEKLEEILHWTLKAHPDSELAREIKALIDQERLFYVVGKWPPQS